MARDYNKIEKHHPTYEQQLLHSVDAWTEYAVLRKPVVKFETQYIQWRCYKCSKPILVKYNISRFRYLYCERCRPRFVRVVDAIMLRYFLRFKDHVKQLILFNMGLGKKPKDLE